MEQKTIEAGWAAWAAAHPAAVKFLESISEKDGVFNLACSIVADKIAVREEAAHGRWAPRFGEVYYYVSSTLCVECTMNDETVFDKEVIDAGNCFQTVEAAEKGARVIREALKGLRRFKV